MRGNGVRPRGRDGGVELPRWISAGVTSRRDPLRRRRHGTDRERDDVSKYLVTGGGGFIGSNVVDRLLADGDSVRVLDNFSTGKRANLAHVLADIDLIEGDLTSYERVHNAVRGVDHVLHLGALPSVPRSVQDPLTTSQVNIVGTLNVLLASRDEGVHRVVYASSSSVYGDTPKLPKAETMPTRPMSPYAVAKLSGEGYCRSFHSVYGIETAMLRYFNVFGPRQDPTSQYSAVIPAFISRMLQGRPPVINGDGEQSRDFTYVENVVSATIAAASAPPAIAGQEMNVACGERSTLNDLVTHVNSILGTDLVAEYAPSRPGDVRHSLADISRAKELMGYAPTVHFEEGLRRTVDWLRAEP
jgi:UDP-glucose 4-epimerase